MPVGAGRLNSGSEGHTPHLNVTSEFRAIYDKKRLKPKTGLNARTSATPKRANLATLCKAENKVCQLTHY